MSGKVLILVLAAAGAALAVSGCVNAKVDTPVAFQVATVGQQLIDLHQTFEAGVINQSEYQRRKAEIMESAGQRRTSSQFIFRLD